MTSMVGPLTVQFGAKGAYTITCAYYDGDRHLTIVHVRRERDGESFELETYGSPAMSEVRPEVSSAICRGFI